MDNSPEVKAKNAAALFADTAGTMTLLQLLHLIVGGSTIPMVSTFVLSSLSGFGYWQRIRLSLEPTVRAEHVVTHAQTLTVLAICGKFAGPLAMVGTMLIVF